MCSATAFARHLPANGYRRVRWRNGLGWTREIHAATAPGREDWDWRLSIAEIEADGPYSTFPGMEREQVLLSGAGLALAFDGARELLLVPPHGRQRFDGTAPVQARLQAGRVEVFNVIWNPVRVAVRLWHRPLVGSMILFVDPGATWAVYLLSGHAILHDAHGEGALDMGDSALLAATHRRQRYALEGGGEVLLVRVEPAAT